MMQAGTKIIHQPSGRVGVVIDYSQVMNEELVGEDRHMQVQFEGHSFPSLVRCDEIKEMLLG